MPLIEHLASVMPRDATGEGYDYSAFLDALVNGTTCIKETGISDRAGGSDRTSSNGTRSATADLTRVVGGMAQGSRHYL